MRGCGDSGDVVGRADFVFVNLAAKSMGGGDAAVRRDVSVVLRVDVAA